jgi:DNA uptake protein ComE-like DNA-binding protein
MIFRMKFVRLITFALATILFSRAVDAPLPAQTASQTKKPDSKAAASGDLIDINHASAAELKTLPGIGDAYSLAIIKHRPYKNKTQLRSGGVIPEATYNKIRDKIIAKQ